MEDKKDFVERALFDLETRLETSFRQFDPKTVVELKRLGVIGVIEKHDLDLIGLSERTAVLRLGAYEEGSGKTRYLCAKIPRVDDAATYVEAELIIGYGKSGSCPYIILGDNKTPRSNLKSEKNVYALQTLGFDNVAFTRDVKLDVGAPLYEVGITITEDATEGGRSIVHPAKKFPFNGLGWVEGMDKYQSQVNRIMELNSNGEYSIEVEYHAGEKGEIRPAIERMFFVIDDPKTSLANYRGTLKILDTDHVNIKIREQR